MSRDWGNEAHQAGIRRLDLCEAWQYYNEGGQDDGELPPDTPDPSCAPFCGCETCVVREVLDAAWPIMVEAMRSGDFDEPPEPTKLTRVQ